MAKAMPRLKLSANKARAHGKCFLCQRAVRRGVSRHHFASQHSSFVQFVRKRQGIGVNDAAVLLTRLSVKEMAELQEEFLQVCGPEMDAAAEKEAGDTEPSGSDADEVEATSSSPLEILSCFQCQKKYQEDLLELHFASCHPRVVEYLIQKHDELDEKSTCELLVQYHRHPDLLEELRKELDDHCLAASPNGSCMLDIKSEKEELDDEEMDTVQGGEVGLERSLELKEMDLSEDGSGGASTRRDGMKCRPWRRVAGVRHRHEPEPIEKSKERLHHGLSSTLDQILEEENAKTNMECVACISIQCFRRCILKILSDILQYGCNGHAQICCCDKEIFRLLTPMYAAFVVKGKADADVDENIKDVEDCFFLDQSHGSVNYYCKICPLQDAPIASKLEGDCGSSFSFMERWRVRFELQDHLDSPNHLANQRAFNLMQKKVQKDSKRRRLVRERGMAHEEEEEEGATLEVEMEGMSTQAGGGTTRHIASSSSYARGRKRKMKLKNALKMEGNGDSDTPDEADYRCFQCLEDFSSAREKQSHVLASHPIPRTCYICSQTFPSENILRVHNVIDHRQAARVCEFCQKEFVSEEKLNSHRKKCRSRDPVSSLSQMVMELRCRVCHVTFRTTRELVVHEKETHDISPVIEDEKPFMCPVCHKSFTNPFAAKMHISKIHPTYWNEFLRDHGL